MGFEYEILFGRPEGKRPLGKPGELGGYDAHIKMNFKEIGYMGVVGLIGVKVGSSNNRS